MNSWLPLSCLLVLSCPPGAAAQTSQGAADVGSFAVVQHLLSAGEAVRVVDDRGATTKGTMVSVSDTELVVARRRALFGRPGESRTRAFTRDSIAAIGVEDSTWNGALIGGATTAVMLGVWARQCETGECMQGRALTAVLGTAAGLGAGALVDSLMSHRIYERPARAALLVAPSVARGRRAVVAQLRW